MAKPGNKAMVMSATQALAKIQGSVSDPARVNNRLALAADRFNLLSPATSVGDLPDGTAVALSAIYVDRRLTKDGGDCWAMGGGMLMPAKHKIAQISGALGISWDPMLSGRVDDGSDPHYCKWRAVGRYRRFDGTWQTTVAHKQMDLRDDSPVVTKLRKDAAAKGRSADNQITELRAFIEEHAETKAQLRAVRFAAGMKTSYTAGELEKPFVAAQLVLTTPSDPQLRAMLYQQMLTGGAAMYGPAPSAPALPAATMSGMLHSAQAVATLEPPPPVGAVEMDDDDMYEPPPAQQQQPSPQAVSPPAPASNGGDRPLVCPWGDYKGKPWGEVPQEVLMHHLDRFHKALQQGTAKDPARMQRHVAAIEEALGVPPEEPGPEGQASLPIDDDGQY